MEDACKKIVAAAAVILLLVAAPSPSTACGPRFTESFFSYTLHPDVPLSKYAAGKLGLVKPTYARSYLVVAYRYLTNKPLTAAEQKDCLTLWDARVFGASRETCYGTSDAAKAWLAARRHVVGGQGSDAEIDTYRSVSDGPEGWGSFENCPASAFQAAVTTLADRVAKFGAGSTTVSNWVSGQDQVFCHCGSRQYNYQTKKLSPEGAFSDPLPGTADPLARADRSYQIAAAHFYAKQYDAAEAEFRAIASDSSSPWSNMGLYLAARCMIRKATLPDSVNIVLLKKAADQLNEILKDSRLQIVHKEAAGLLAFAMLRIEPEARLLALSHDLLEPANESSFRQNLNDYTFLLEKYLPDDSDGNKASVKPVPELLTRDDLSDWIATFQSKEKQESNDRALARWRQTRSLPWLLAALSKCDPASSSEQDLFAAARALSVSSPAYLTACYYMIDLMIKTKQCEAATKMLGNVLKQELPPSARNDFLHFDLALAQTLAEFMKVAARTPASYFREYFGEFPYDQDNPIEAEKYPVTKESCFDSDGANMLNYTVPLDLLAKAVVVPDLQTQIAFDLAQAVFTRAIVLKRDDVALTMLPLLKRFRPDMSPLLDSYQKAASPAQRRFAAVLFMLRNPGSAPYVTPGAPREVDFGKIEDYGDNWWGVSGLVGGSGEQQTVQPSKLSNHVPFLSAAEVKLAQTEVAALRAAGEAPNWLTAQVLQYARNNPGDPLIPEALHRCVRATKLGSTDKNTTVYSKQAFQLLQKQYHNSLWAKKTPYYY